MLKMHFRQRTWIKGSADPSHYYAMDGLIKTVTKLFNL